MWATPLFETQKSESGLSENNPISPRVLSLSLSLSDVHVSLSYRVDLRPVVSLGVRSAGQYGVSGVRRGATVVRGPEWVVPDVGAMSPSAWTFPRRGATARALLVPALLGCSSHRRYRAARPPTPRRTLRPREKTPRCRAAELGCHTSRRARPMSSLGGGGRVSRAG